MENQVSKSKLKAKALEYFRQVQKTKRPIVITEHGRPVLKIVPYSEDPRGALKTLRHSVIEYRNPLEPVGLEDWDLLR